MRFGSIDAPLIDKYILAASISGRVLWHHQPETVFARAAQNITALSDWQPLEAHLAVGYRPRPLTTAQNSGANQGGCASLDVRHEPLLSGASIGGLRQPLLNRRHEC